MSKFEISVRVPLIIEADGVGEARQIAGNILSENSHFFADMFGALNMPDDSEPSIYAVEFYRKENPARHDMRVLFVAHDEGTTKLHYHTPREFSAIVTGLEGCEIDYKLSANASETNGDLLLECEYCFEELEQAE